MDEVRLRPSPKNRCVCGCIFGDHTDDQGWPCSKCDCRHWVAANVPLSQHLVDTYESNCLDVGNGRNLVAEVKALEAKAYMADIILATLKILTHGRPQPDDHSGGCPGCGCDFYRARIEAARSLIEQAEHK